MGSRRKHSKEFKLEAVRLASQPGSSVPETAENLGINPSLLYTWKRELAADGDQAFPGNGRLKADEEEIRKLRLELKRVREERDILEKATFLRTGGSASMKFRFISPHPRRADRARARPSLPGGRGRHLLR
jgi:transposase